MSVAAVGAAVVGGAMAMSASSKASKAQQAGADAAIASQEYMYDQTRTDNAPFRETGLQANNRLAMLMGIGGQQNYSAGENLATANLTNGTSYNPDLYANNPAYRDAWDNIAAQHYAAYGKNYNADSDMGWVESVLRSSLAGDIAKQKAENLAAQEAAKNDPLYGSLLKNYGQSDAENDYIYQTQKQFGLDEGTKGLNRIAAASGNMLSGAAAKALTRFGNDYAGTKLGESYNRFENNKTSTYNKLAGISGTGQQATNQVSAAGQNMANNNSATQIGLGNARGASAIAQGNALSNGLSSAYNGYQQSQLMNKLFPTSYGVAQQPGVTDWVSQG